MRMFKSLARLLAAVALLALISAPAVLGYAGEVAGQVIVSGPGVTVSCAEDATLTAHVVDNTGKPIEGQPLSWEITQRQHADDRLSDTETVTDANGDAKTRLIFGPAEGPRTVRATADDEHGDTVVTCAGGLPPTSTVPPATGPAWAMVLAGAAVLLGSFLAVRRIRG